MSAGPFNIGIYTADSLEKHNIKYQPETAVFSIDGSPNVIPAGPVTTPEWVLATKNNRGYGLRTRKLKFRWNNGAEPAGYSPGSTVDITVFDPAVWATTTVGSPGTYLGGAGIIRGKIPEQRFPVA